MKKKLIILGITLLIIIIGIVMACIFNFNFGFEFGNYTALDVYMIEESNIDDVKEIITEVFSGEYKVEYTDEFYDTISIKLKDASDEQIEEIKNKLVEKYEFEDVENYILEINVPAVEVYDLVKEYIKPIVISFIIIIIYFGIAFRKLGTYKSIMEPIIITVIMLALYISILAICRIPINDYSVPIGIFIYMMSLLGITLYLNNKNKVNVSYSRK